MQLLIGALSEKWITMRALVQLGHVTVPFPARARHRTRRLNHGKSNTCWISEIGEWRFLDSGAGQFEREFGTGKFQNKKCSAILVKSQWIFSSKKSPQRICKDLHQFISLFEEPKVKAHGSCRNLCKYPRFLVYMSAETKQMHLFFKFQAQVVLGVYLQTKSTIQSNWWGWTVHQTPATAASCLNAQDPPHSSVVPQLASHTSMASPCKSNPDWIHEKTNSKYIEVERCNQCPLSERRSCMVPSSSTTLQSSVSRPLHVASSVAK